MKGRKIKGRFVGLHPTPRELFEKSSIKNLKGNALRAFPGDFYILVGLIVIALMLVGRVGAFASWSSYAVPVVADEALPEGVAVDAFLVINDGDWEPHGSDAVVPTASAIRNAPDITPIRDSGLLWLVNHENPLDAQFSPQNLVTHQGVRLRAQAHTAYNRMLTAMKAEMGAHDLQLISAYRPYDYQRSLFEKRVGELAAQGHSPAEADEIATKSLQRPGASEHQTGLALDVTVTGHLTQDFAATAAGQWLAVNSHRFGFIIRYPRHKTEITQIVYEPWHMRYVGIPHAHIIWENGLTLEEYAQFIAAGPYIHWCRGQANNPNPASREYYLIIYSEFWPEQPPPGLTDISATSYGGNSGYIMTLRRNITD